MKKYYLILIILISALSCIGSDTTFLPKNFLEAKEKNLLIKEYQPSKNKIIINSTEYLILESFTTFKYNSKRDQTINKNFFAFILKLKNIKTEEEYLLEEDAINYKKFINFYCDMCGGLDTDNIVLRYNDITKREKLDNIKFGFKDNQGFEDIVIFTKK